MTAIGRLGGEWQIGYTPDAGRSIHGRLTNSTKSSIVQPGRTGGGMFRHYGGLTSTVIGPRKLPAYTTLHCDLATNEAPGLHGNIGNPDPYQLPEGEFLIGRVYARIPALPDAPGVTDPGIPILILGDVASSTIGAAGASVGIWLCNDGTFRFIGAGGFALAPTDGELTMPVGEWVMLEIAVSYETEQPRRAFVRVTLPDEPPQVIYRNCNLLPLTPAHDFYVLQSVLSAGCFQYQATSFDTGNFVSESWYIDVDDMGVNTSEGEVNNTWLGPGVVRVARPIEDGDADPAWDVGGHSSTRRGEGGRTNADHPCVLLPTGPVCLTCVDAGDSVELCAAASFWDALNNNPVVNPATSVAEPFARCRFKEMLVTSVGTDWHVHTGLVDLPAGCAFAYDYDDPRVAFAGEALEVVCDASDRVGDISFARAVAFAGKIGWFGGSSDTVQFPHRGDFYLSMWTDNEDEPLLGGPEDGGFSDDLAHTNFGMWMQTVLTIESAWRGALGRFQQLPELAETPTLTFRREHFQHVLANHAGVGAEPGSFAELQEFYLLGAGIIYESGFEPQPPLPDCEPGELVIGDMRNHIRQVRGGRLGLNATNPGGD